MEKGSMAINLSIKNEPMEENAHLISVIFGPISLIQGIGMISNV
jgi:hypothetical protein